MMCYIAGPIGNTTDFLERFAAACNEVALLGHVPVSPIEVCNSAGLVTGEHQWIDYMRADIRALLECEGLYALRGWEHSRGARLEHLIAEALGYRIIYQHTEEER